MYSADSSDTDDMHVDSCPVDGESKQGSCSFDPKEMEKYFTMMLYGARRVGKTHMASFILSQIHKDMDEVYLLSETAVTQPDAWPFIPKKNKMETWDEGRLMKIIQSQEAEIVKARRKLLGNDVDGAERKRKRGTKQLEGDALRDAISNIVPYICIICDDMINNPQVRRSEVLKRLFVSGRHNRMSLIFLSQCPARSVGLSGIMRTNVDYCLTSEMDSADDLETLATLFFAVEGKKPGIARIRELTYKQYHFAVSKMIHRPKHGLACYTCAYKAPSVIPKFELNCAKDLREFTHSRTADDAGKNYIMSGYRQRGSEMIDFSVASSLQTIARHTPGVITASMFK